MIKNLVIVESPAKAKTIEKFLGKDFTVKSCFGHIRDLAEDGLSVDVKRNFEPNYVVPEDKKKIVGELKKLAKEAETTWLATDEDREGEAISWHLAETLDLEKEHTRRIVFHEITKPAILSAIEHPREIDENLVNAQQARRILDRLVGFELSPILWRKIKPALSAGRVQSVAVRLIVEREREIIAHEYKSSYKVTASFHPVKADGTLTDAVLKAELPEKFNTLPQARAFLETCLEAQFSIQDIEVKPATKSPAPPFTTSTLQQEASRKLGYSVTRTMVVAQKLYEAGHITYMRTDSLNLAETALEDIKKDIISSYGENYAHQRKYTTKNASAQEAHEAIRPTYIANHAITGDNAEVRLYDLIWKRTIASQMANAKLEKTNVKIKVSSSPLHLLATGEVLKFDGFLKVYLESKDDEEDEEVKGMLPPLNPGQKLSLIELIGTERYNRPPARYTEASLVKKLEELGIGRPSTYAPTINTVQNRGYVIKGDQDGEERQFNVLTLKNKQIKEEINKEVFGRDRNKLFPSNIGMMVNDFLLLHFDTVLDYQFTANVEKEFDEIAEGKKQWQDMLEEFYGPFHEIVEETTKSTIRVRSEREIGVDPKTGRKVYARMGKFGPHVQIGETDNDEKPLYARLRKNQLIDTITMEEAMDLFKLPRNIGDFEGEKVVVSIGKFGPYVSHNKAFYSLPKDEDPYSIELPAATEIIVRKRIEKENKTIKTFEYEEKPMQLLRGRFGPYIAYDRLNVTIPKGTDPETITLEECLVLIEAKRATSPKKPEKKKPEKKTAEKKPAVKRKAPAKKKAVKKS